MWFRFGLAIYLFIAFGCGGKTKISEMEVGSIPAFKIESSSEAFIGIERLFDYLSKVEKICEVDNRFIIYFPQSSLEGAILYFPLKDTSCLKLKNIADGSFKFTRLELFNIASIKDEKIEFKPDSEKFNFLVSYVGRYRYNMLIPGFYQVYNFSKSTQGYVILNREVWVSYKVHRRSKPIGD